ncbi:AraC family transcriptional regulator [Shewanella sp. VB17]|nr:AraC family transcriptional regulator [Shewanella sp. VB17]
MHSTTPFEGVELLQAWFAAEAYDKHRHDTYAIGLTDLGVQSYDYRGEKRVSTAGKVMVLHPDELHNGHAGSDAGFGYRIAYIDPACISDAVNIIVGRPCPLPFVKETVSDNKILANVVQFLFNSGTKITETLAKDEIILQLASGLIAADPDCARLTKKYTVDDHAVGIAREYLSHNHHRVIHSIELESITGLTRYDLIRQFKKVLGTSPYQYSIHRRLATARDLLQQNMSLVETALATGFCDQAHFNRMFKSTYGITPGRYTDIISAN